MKRWGKFNIMLSYYFDKTYLQTMLRFLDALLVTMSAELFRRYRISHVYSSMSLHTNFDSVIYIDVWMLNISFDETGVSTLA